MNFDAAERIARALLYEGYLLYPYRPSALKNQQRWTFGCLFPPDFPQPPNSAEGSFALMECLLEGDLHDVVEVRARFLQIEAGTGKVNERQVIVADLALSDLVRSEHCHGFSFAPIEGAIQVAARHVGDNRFQLRVELRNLTPIENGSQLTRDRALPFSLLSSHIVIGISRGKFFSMQAPPPAIAEHSGSCRNVRFWPVLVGDLHTCNLLLAAPIILPDFPQIADESPGDTFDATEMDEMLSLRIRTLTPAEKQEMAATDPRGASLLLRSEELDERQLNALHGTWRHTDVPHLHPGTRVRLRPNRKADVYDLALKDKTAVVVSIERDFEDCVYVCVALDDDPGQDYGIQGRPGHRFFFGIDEVEPLPRPRILIAGIGNIFLGDDALGVEVIRRLAERRLPEEVIVKDFGIRGFDLACALQDGYEAAILVDAIQRGGEPGTLHVIEPDATSASDGTPMEMHHLDPVRIIEMVTRMGGQLPLLRVVGCEPESFEPNDGQLSEPVQNAVPKAVELVESLVAELLRSRGRPSDERI